MGYNWHRISWLLATPLIPAVLRAFVYRKLGVDMHITARVAHGVFIGGNTLVMKEHTFVNIGCFLDGSAAIYLGEYVRLGPYVKILTGTHTYAHSTLRRGPGSVDVCEPVILEQGVWVGMGALILPGVIVREGCIIGAGAILTKSTEPNGLYAGNPARRIKDLPVVEVNEIHQNQNSRYTDT